MLPMAGIVDGLRKIREAWRGFVLGATGSGTQEGASALAKSGRSGSFGLHGDPRRYKRALLLAGGSASDAGHGIQQKIASASASFRGRTFSVVDLSHTGVAIERVDISDATLPDSAKPELMVLHLGMQDPFSVHVVHARSSERVVAFEFLDVTTDARLAVDRFLDPKMIGLNMRAIDRSFFSPGETFSLWFCGPRDTNFFLWMNDGKLDRAIVQLGDGQFTINRDEMKRVRVVRNTAGSRAGAAAELRDSVLFSLDVALQVKNGGAPISELVKVLTEAADSQPATM